MLPIKLSSIVEQCQIDVKSDTRNTYSFDRWPQSHRSDDKSYVESSQIPMSHPMNPENERNTMTRESLCSDVVCPYYLHYADGEAMSLRVVDPEPMFDKKSILTMTSDIKYRFSNKVYEIDRQISMIKLFIAVYIARKIVKYNIINENSIEFTFYLYNHETNLYDKRIPMILDTQILVDNSGLPIIIQSKSLLDHLLLKGFIKLSNIMNINIKDINVNSLICASVGGALYKLSVPQHIASNLESIEFTVENVLLNRCETQEETEIQSTWISDNILKVIIGDEVTPYNEYAKLVHDLYKNNMLLGMSLSNSFMYIVSNMWTDQYGGLNIRFYNIFTGTDIEISFASVIYGLGQIGVMCKL